MMFNKWKDLERLFGQTNFLTINILEKFILIKSQVKVNYPFKINMEAWRSISEA